jgi:type IV pilus assembly protein PilO
MTNLQQGSSRLPVATLRLIWLTLPAAVLGGLGLLVVMAGLLPLWAALQRDSQRLQELGQLRDQVTLMRGQLVATRENTETAMASKAKIERLITGYSDLSTFLATLDREADASDVQLTLFEPTQAAATPGTAPGAAAAAPAAAPAPGAAAPAPGAAAPAPGAAAPDPLALEGLTLRTLLVSARGSFPALLAFLRRLEALNVLVVQSDLNLTLPEVAASEGGTPKPSNEVVMKLTLGLYSRTPAPAPPDAAAPAAAPATPATPN